MRGGKPKKKGLMLKNITISNFKSYKECKIELCNFNLLVGPNGSGKTNLVELFKLLKGIYKEKEISPFLPWRGYQNVVWKQDETLPIAVNNEFI